MGRQYSLLIDLIMQKNKKPYSAKEHAVGEGLASRFTSNRYPKNGRSKPLPAFVQIHIRFAPKFTRLS